VRARGFYEGLNLVFSAWDRIFKDPMTTAAAIDRVVHNAVIVEMVGETNRGPFTEDTPPKRGGGEPHGAPT
jgi:hypothetical protein